MGKISRWFPPFCGLLAVALGIVVSILIGEGQDPSDKSAQEIANYYSDHNVKHIIGSIGIAFVAIALLYFAGWLRRVLRDAEGSDGILSAVAFAGAVTFAAGAAIGGSIHWALADFADNIDPVAVQAVNAIDFDMFLFFPVGLSTMVLAAGISAVRHGGMPRWFAWTGVVLGVLGYTPGFFIVWFLVPLAPLWIVILSIMGMRGTVGERPVPDTA
jgi:hypothetical protein